MKQNKANLPTLDLHGLTEDEVFDRVDKFIYKHSQSDASRVRIIHGKGKGIVKKKLTEYLRLGNYSYKSDDGNDGAMIIFI